MDDVMFDPMSVSDELTRRLGAFAEGRLTPDLGASSRMRAKVLAVAHRQAARSRTDASLTILGPSSLIASGAPGARRVPRRRFGRRLAAVALAASLAIGVGAGSVLASRAGGPLYMHRLWVETLALPSDPAARAAAELSRLDERVSEATAASVIGDAAAAGAALSAYEAIVGDVVALVDADPRQAATVAASVARNVEALSTLAGRVPEAARAAIDRAIERSNAIAPATDGPIDDSEGVHRGGGDGASDGNGAANGNGGSEGNGNGAGAGGGANDPGATKDGRDTAKPSKDPKPKPTAGTPAADPNSGASNGNGNGGSNGNGNGQSNGNGNGQSNGNGNGNGGSNGNGNGQSNGNGNGNGGSQGNGNGNGNGNGGSQGNGNGNGAADD